MIANYTKTLRGPKHPNLLREYLRERERNHFKIREAGIDPADLLVRCLLKHALDDFAHAVKNVFAYWRGRLIPKHYLALIETTGLKDTYRSWEAVHDTPNNTSGFWDNA